MSPVTFYDQETPLSDLAVYSARPTLHVDGQERAEISSQLLEMRMEESQGGLSSLELRFSNVSTRSEGDSGLAFEEANLLRLGTRIQIFAGDENDPREIFSGLVTGLEAEFPEEGPPELIVLGEDALQRARMQRRSRVVDHARISNLASDLADDIGLRAAVDGFSDDIGTQVQLNESDLAFLRRLLRRSDGDLQVAGNELHVAPRSQVRRNEIQLALHSQLRRARLLADLAHQVTTLTVTGWDAVQGRQVSASSSGNALSPGQGQTGSELLQDAIGERPHHVAHLAATTQAEAQALADAAFDERARRLVTVEATAEGNPNLRVGTHVTLTGIGERFENTYYVTRTLHRFDMRNGYETDFEAECAFFGGSS